MECYYDQAFIALRDRQAEQTLCVTTLPVARAVLSHRGHTREVSPDGRQPLVYDYDYVDPAPLARMSGKLTRYGDVACLLQADDDRFCAGLPGRRTTTISASSRRARRVKSSRARFDPESQGRFALPVTGHVVSTGTKRPFT